MITITPRINQYNNHINTSPSKNKNFKGYTTVFSKELDKVIKNGGCSFQQEKKLVALLKDFLQNKLTHKRLIGEGHYGKVYKLDTKYVVKVLDKETIFADNLSSLSKNKFKNLKTYYGEPVAEFYDAFILKNMSGRSHQIPVGVPKKFTKFYSEEDCENYYKKVYLPIFSSVEQKSYNAIAKDCLELNKMNDGDYYYNFDYCNPNNFVLTGKTLRITDSIYKTALHNPNTTIDLLEVFLDKMSRYKLAPNPDKETLPYIHKIFKKIVTAANSCNLPLGDEISGCISEWGVITQRICGLKTPHQEILKTLHGFQKEIPDTTKRVTATKQYLDKIIKESTEK